MNHIDKTFTRVQHQKYEPAQLDVSSDWSQGLSSRCSRCSWLSEPHLSSSFRPSVTLKQMVVSDTLSRSKTDQMDQFERRPTKTLNLHIPSLFFHIWILVFGFCLRIPEISSQRSPDHQFQSSGDLLWARVQTWFRYSGALGRAETWDLIFDICSRLTIVSLCPISCSESVSSVREFGQVRLSAQVWFYLKRLGGSPSAFMCHRLPEISWLGGSQEQTKLIWRLLLWKPFPAVDDKDEATG